MRLLTLSALICSLPLLTSAGAAEGEPAATAEGEQAATTVSGDYKWGKKGGTITGTLEQTDTKGTFTIKLVPVWGGKPKKGYDGTITINDKGEVSGEITHSKEGLYKLTGTLEGDKLTCQYDGKKSKQDNPLNLTIKKGEG